MSKTYCIISVAEVTSLPVDFSLVLETSADTLRYSLDNTLTFVKYTGDQPAFLNGKTEYSYEDFKTVLSGSNWSFTQGTLDVSGVSNTGSLNGTNSSQSISISGASPNASPVYSWTATDNDGNSTSNVVFSASSNLTTDITYNAAGTFIVKMTITDSNNVFDDSLEGTITVVVS